MILSQPHTHLNQELQNKDNEIDKLRGELELYLDENASDYIIPDGPYAGENYLKDLFYAKVIRINDVLQIKKAYKNNTINVHIQCKVTNFDDGILSVMLIDHNEEQKEGIFLLEQLEEWLLKHSFDAEDRPGSYKNSDDNIEVIRNERFLGSIRMQRKCYIEYKKSHANSTTKPELKHDVDLSGTGKLPSLAILSKFWNTYIKDTPLSYMNKKRVNGRPAIIAYVHVPKGTPVELPAEFEGYPVFMDYGTIELASPVTLSPNISIGSISAYMLGALFKNEMEMEKSFILTTKHSVGKTDSMVIQPVSSDTEKGYTICAKVSKYNYYGVIYEHEDALLLDYAFCEVINSEVASTNNIPIQCEFYISSTKDSVSGFENKYKICKVGRITNYTEGVVEDKLEDFVNRKFGCVKTLVVRMLEKTEERFGAPGDSGSSVFDKYNTLWGILQGISSDGSTASVVPIHLILQHVRREFGYDN
ncbi:hypothetical protein RhiirA4_455408 [Rhizophagus irregularis]|uniref:Uncharacterized protein n=1 Tax=Rhizophagus irregularis TaxID=588596 RepID=A0A2I1G547_9GLOM|nr:hypothetical protein RhiirA4_455408 [Rhizophagus irregularis]